MAAIKLLQERLDRLDAYFNKQENPQAACDHEVTQESLAKLIGVEWITLTQWSDKRLVVPTRMNNGNQRIYKLWDVYRQLESVKLERPNPLLNPEPSVNTSAEKKLEVVPGLELPPEAVVGADGIPRVPMDLSQERLEGRLLRATGPFPDPQFVALPDAMKTEVKTEATGDKFIDARNRAIRAAKEAYRDVMLELADEAKRSGNKDLQIRALEEFVWAEEHLRLLHVER